MRLLASGVRLCLCFAIAFLVGLIIITGHANIVMVLLVFGILFTLNSRR